MNHDDLDIVTRLAGINRKVSEDEQDDFEQRDAIAKLKKLTSGNEYNDANHTHIDPKTGAIIYSRDGSPMPISSFTDPKYATASVGLELRTLLKQAGLPVTADAKGNARVDPAAFANLGKAPAQPTAAPARVPSADVNVNTPPVSTSPVASANIASSPTVGSTTSADSTAAAAMAAQPERGRENERLSAGGATPAAPTTTTSPGSQRVPVGTTDQTMFDRVKYLVNRRR